MWSPELSGRQLHRSFHRLRQHNAPGCSWVHRGGACFEFARLGLAVLLQQHFVQFRFLRSVCESHSATCLGFVDALDTAARPNHKSHVLVKSRQIILNIGSAKLGLRCEDSTSFSNLYCHQTTNGLSNTAQSSQPMAKSLFIYVIPHDPPNYQVEPNYWHEDGSPQTTCVSFVRFWPSRVGPEKQSFII